MTFHRIRDVQPPGPTEFVCRQSRSMHLIPVVFGAAVLVGIFFVPAEGVIKWLRWVIALFFVLFTWGFFNLFRRSAGPQSWLLRINPRGILIKFRSYANAHFDDDDEVIVQVQPREIEWVAMLREQILRPGDADTATVSERWTYVELGLRDDVDVTELSSRLKAERDRPPQGKRVKSRYQDFPVRLVEDRTLRLQWRGGSNFVVPAAKRAVAEISRAAPSAQVRETREKFFDGVQPAKEKAQQEAQIIEMLERGNRIGAVKLARRCYGCSLTEAQQFVDGLLTSSKSADTQSR